MEHRPKLFYQKWFRGKACFVWSKLASLCRNLFPLTRVGSYSWVKSSKLSKVNTTEILSEWGLEPCLQRLVSCLFPCMASLSDSPLSYSQVSQRHSEKLQLFFYANVEQNHSNFENFCQAELLVPDSPIMESYAPMRKREKCVSLSRLQNVKCCCWAVATRWIMYQFHKVWAHRSLWQVHSC